MPLDAGYSQVGTPSLDWVRQAFAPALREGRATRAIVFGSYARGKADAYSDLDLIIIADSCKPFFHRHEDFHGIYEVWPRGLDILIYTPDELAQMLADDNPFIQRALQEGVVVYEG